MHSIFQFSNLQSMLSKNARKNITLGSIGVFFFLCFGCKQDPIEYNHRMLLVIDGIFEDAKSIDSSLEKKRLRGSGE
ncbi:hypothetical protein LEP1GSC059_2815 [Leptospira noguchii serovar Panama str. CZ214]|uniref:Uncharacterized protein n=2 Tax=Leptospira noguchii TaxID=28182 RepID=T0GRC1_9LEPT|nr:hypothetical protein LEP1GSC059_2815 [Leptospira noguchii serovar Panama str. CZ214]